MDEQIETVMICKVPKILLLKVEVAAELPKRVLKFEKIVVVLIQIGCKVLKKRELLSNQLNHLGG